VLDGHVLGRGNQYLCGDTITIADFYGASFVALGELTGSDFAAYPNVKAWLGRMKALKHWAPVNEVINGYAATLKGQSLLAV
jgi:glutathione S-transferase